jgi:uncharacterized repeat protein (TIGR03837 family)
MLRSCDIFCNVVDNYGDIGVCWRLARQLANEQGLAVRLWVDDLASFTKLCPTASVADDVQQCRGVTVSRWYDGADCVVYPMADLVIAAFACRLPDGYLQAMAAQSRPPIWVNLDYLSAEAWVEGCHGLPSPHPSLPLTKYFFFPGFTEKTGGLLLERDLLQRRDAFMQEVVLQSRFWQSLGMVTPASEVLKVSLFAYENAALSGLFDAWSSGERTVLCLVPEGRILPQVGAYFGVEAGSGGQYVRGRLTVRILPFVEQEAYDTLLWSCDLNFVRGEDSCVRAQWAGKPFVWQIYPQHDAVHWEKLQALLDLYGQGLDKASSLALQDFWRAWNAEDGAGAAWPKFAAVLDVLETAASGWSAHLEKNNLALNLLDFCLEMGRMRAFKIEGQSS